jgi:hypothetical protein
LCFIFIAIVPGTNLFLFRGQTFTFENNKLIATKKTNMKKQPSIRIVQLLCLLLLFGSQNYKAQSGLNNLSFESWTTTPLGPTPTGWIGANASQQTTGPQQGSNYLRINNTSSYPGMVMLGSTTTYTGNFNGGIPYTQTPASLSGFYKTSGMASGDTISMMAYTSKTGTIIALGTFTQAANISAWTSFSMSFISFNPGPIDSLFIMLSSDNMFGNSNSLTATLDVDNLSLATVTGLDKNSISTAFLVYPNPASNELTIVSKEEKAVTILIMDINGRRVDELPLETEKTKLDLQKYAGGIYLYSILDKEKRSLLSNRFVVVR